MTDNQINGQADQIQWSEDQLEDGNPIEYEDKWGKSNQPSFAVKVPTGIKASLSSNLIEKFKLNNNLTIEFWLKVESSTGSIDIITTENFKITLSTGGTLHINDSQRFNLTRDPFQSLNTWQHLCFLLNSTDASLQVFQNSQEILNTQNKIVPQLSNCSNLTLLTPKNANFWLSELRFWAVNLPVSILKENMRLPLAMLYEQKRAIKIRIKKNESNSQSAAIPGKKVLGKPLGGGLSKPSGLVKPAVVVESVAIEKLEPKIEEEVKQPIIEPPVSQNAAFDFGDGFNPSQTINTVQQPSSDGFDFFGGFSQPEVKQADQGFMDFGSSFKSQPEESKQVISQPTTTSEFQWESPLPVQPDPPKIIEDLQKTLPSTVPLKIKTISKGKPIDFDTQISQIVSALAQSQLSEAETLIEQGITSCRGLLLMGGEAEKERLKVQVRAYATFKLTHKISKEIALIKNHLGMLQAQEGGDQNQIEDMQSQLASLSNLLIILQLPAPSSNPNLTQALKKTYLQFALNQNIRLRNFNATSKIVQFYRKQILEQEQPSDKQKIDQIEAMCQKFQNQNLSSRPNGYIGAECQACEASLPFGLATPQCQSCKAKVGVCFNTLKPLLTEKAYRCNLCLAKFIKIKDPVCQICCLAKVSQPK